MRAILTCLALIAISAHAEDVRVYQIDAYGNIQHNKPSYTLKADGRVILTDAYGNKQYNQQQFVITNNKIVPVDTYGNRQYSKTGLVIEHRTSQKQKP